MIGVVLLFGAAAFAVWVVRNHLNEVAAEQTRPQHVHRPMVVQDGTVDICAACGERLVDS